MSAFASIWNSVTPAGRTSDSTLRLFVVEPTARPTEMMSIADEPADGGLIWRLYSNPLPSGYHLSKPFGYVHVVPLVHATFAEALPATTVPLVALRVDSPFDR